MENKEKLKSIIQIVCGRFEVEQKFIHQKTRKRKYVEVRQIIHYFAHKYTTLTLEDIGFLVGKRNHASVIFSIKSVNNFKSINNSYDDLLNKLNKILKFELQSKTKVVKYFDYSEITHYNNSFLRHGK